MKKEPPDVNLAQDSYHDINWKLYRHYPLSKHFINRPKSHSSAVHVSVIPAPESVILLSSSSLSFRQWGRLNHMTTPLTHTREKFAGACKRLKGYHSSLGSPPCEGSHRHGFNERGRTCNHLDQACARNDYAEAVFYEESLQGSEDLAWLVGIHYYIKSGEILSMDRSLKEHRLNMCDGSEFCRDEANSWLIGWLCAYSYFEILYNWIANFALLLFDFYKGLIPVQSFQTGNHTIFGYHTLESSMNLHENLLSLWSRGDSALQPWLYGTA